MKKLIVLFVLVAFASFACAELLPNGDFAAGMSGWGTWGSGSGSGSLGYKWTSHWAYIETTGGVGGAGDPFMVPTTASQKGYCEWWGWGYNVVWRSSSAELIPVTAGNAYTLRGYAKDLTGDGGNFELKFEWLDASGRKPSEGSAVPTWSIFFDGMTTSWVEYTKTETAPAGACYIRPVYGESNPGKTVGIDNLQFLPEPMSIALLGLGGLFLRRRK